MDYKVVIAPRAIDDLRDIALHITPDRPEAAKRLGLALVDKTKVLGNFPFSGRIVPEIKERLIRGGVRRGHVSTLDRTNDWSKVATCPLPPPRGDEHCPPDATRDLPSPGPQPSSGHGRR